ncbi:MAG: twin-arginine translocase subunit TatC, partial [Gemmatimonadota bacterium]|nr:twin-arginine translocase subunit TatC [Gemmatimonadota bacterium]
MARKKKSPQGEMPFLDHLEELRWRILWSAIALVVASFVGFYLVQRFDIPTILMMPVQPYLETEKLVFTRPTDAFLITVKLAIVVGFVLASPVIIRQVWGFLAPALYEEERRMVMPAILAGVGLFISGVWMAYLWVLPAILKVLLSPRFLGTSFEAFITAGEYFRFATQVMMAFGFVFQLPLVMVLLSAMGLVSPHFFSRNRPYAFVVGSIVAAFVTPPDVVSMVMMLAPIMVLYELGILIGKVIWKRRLKRTASIGGIGIILLALTLAGTVGNADAQQRGPPRPDSAQAGQDTSTVRDSARIETDSAGVPIDSAAALGLPTGPSRQFPSPDSIIQALLNRSG